MALLRWVLVASLLSASQVFAAALGEYQVKAVFLFNFSQFVEWPPESFSASDAPFVICLLGKDHVGADLEAAVKTESVQGHPLVIRKSAAPVQGELCHMLFIDDSEIGRLDSILEAVDKRAVLIVSDIDHSAERGAIIQFTSDKNRLRLRINVAAAKAAGLTISSKLLRPAEIVGATPG